MKITPVKIRFAALFILVPIGVLSAASLFNPNLMTSLAHGPIQVGHEGLECADCHIKPEASWRQQIQANVRYAVGTRSEPVDFGYHVVASGTCITCHDRANERHPIYRFREPRFQSALTRVDATSCLGCHTEHTDARAFADIEFCVACHGDLELKSDPIDVSHKQLIADENWGSCLGCHDFHGNHVFETPHRLDAAFLVDEIYDYLNSGPPPYGTTKQFEADLP